ncbi:MAG: hypothetical protein HC805_00205 [Alkalinema sp. RL_2_19]|nr:hypothetical protein [Alkalinema sp. RL_2_19]
MVLTLRQLSIHPVLASLGGWLFAFPLLRAVRLTHAQLLPQLFTPLALFCLWQLLHQPRRRAFLGLLLLSYWQLLSSIYLGWFLFFAIGITSLLGLWIGAPIGAKTLSFWPSPLATGNR